MKFNEARELLLDEGYRIIGEDFEDGAEFGDVPADLPVEGEEGVELDSDVYGAIEQGLGDEGFDPQETADIMTNFTDKINELVEKGVDAADIVKILAYENCPTEDEGLEEEIPADDGEDLTDVPVDEAYMTEGKSKAKSDKFAHKEKVAGKKPKDCCGKKGCKDCDDEELDESLEDDYPETFRRPNNVQQGTDNWDDFKDDFRAKSLFLKKALTPQFVSGIIKDTDFETDDKEIKAYAFSIIEDVFGTKNPVVNLQARIRKHFVKA